MIDPESVTSLITAIGAVASSGIGIYFDRLRKKDEREEPARIEEAATEAVSAAVERPPVTITQVHGHSDTVVASAEEMTKLVSEAVKKELADAQKKSNRVSFMSGLFFFIAGILATIAITLYVHPGK